MIKNLFFIFFFSNLVFVGQAQQYTQTIRGSIIDKESKHPLIGASVVILNSTPLKGSVSDDKGKFRITDVSLGRHSLKISYLGYQDLYIPDISVDAGKEVVLQLEMVESIIEKKEIVIKADKPKDQALNEMAVVSARMFTIEETNRYAGALGDPARMAANYAGANIGSDARNDIIIRGNSPIGLLWRLEGIDIPNPNHFAAQGTTGGPVSMINGNLLSNSDFFTGAFPAEYGNATSGAFDLRMRNGNSEKYEFTGQIGFNGVEAMAEGPFNKSHNSSFLASYRYSVLGLFQALGINLGPAGIPKYQDVSFKINLPTKNKGTFDIFGIGGKSTISILDKERKADNFTYGLLQRDIYFNSDMAIFGVSHLIMSGQKSYFKNSIAITTEGHNNQVDSISPDKNAHNIYYEATRNFNINWHSIYNVKINSTNTLKSGFIASRLSFNTDEAVFSADLNRWLTLVGDTGNTYLIQAYSQLKHDFNSRFTLLTGVHYQYLFLNNTKAIEPRAGISYKLSEKDNIAFGYGIHSQMQPLSIYKYTKYNRVTSQYEETNKELGFSKSQHFVLSYNRQFNANYHFKTELYYQKLYNIPIQFNPTQPLGNSFSILNMGADFNLILAAYLKNKGEGKNYGMEFTFERFFSRGYYFLTTASIFQSQYKGSDGVWRNTAFNSKYIFNGLFGKEFKVRSNSLITMSGKLSWAGGRYYTPIDTVKSRLENAPVFDEEHAFSLQYPDYFRLDARIGYKLNSKKITQEWAIDILNVTNQKNVLTEIYDVQTGKVKKEYQLSIFPVALYRIQF